MGNFIDNTLGCDFPSFQVIGKDSNRGCIGDIGLTFTPQAVNVEDGPVTWTIDSFEGDVINAVIDPITGEITYDVPPSLTNAGRGAIFVTAEDAGKNKVTHCFPITNSDPVAITPLACNANMIENLPLLAAKFTFNGLITETSAYQDLAKTVQSDDGDIVSVLEDGNGNGDATLRIGDDPPSLNIGGAPNNNNYLYFNGSNQALQYDVPGAPSVGTPFRVLFLARIANTANDSNATVMSSTLQADNNSLGNSTWQFSRSSATDQFVFRFDNPVTNVISGNLATGASGDMLMAGWDSGIKDGGWHLVGAVYDGTNVKGYFDGVEVFEAEAPNPLSGEHFKFGENRAGSNYMEMDLAELTYMDSTVNDDDFIRTQAYYLCKFGLDTGLLASDPPYTVDLDRFYDQVSQYQLHEYKNGDFDIWDTLTNSYLDIDNFPVPNIGLFKDIAATAFLNTVSDALSIDTDEQQLSLAGNILTLEDGGTVDLSAFLDNSDDQNITAFTLSPAGVLTLTIEAGNTVTVDLSSLDTDTDDQTLALAGTLLSIADGNTVDLSAFLDDTDISAVSLSLAGDILTSSVTEDGVTLSDTVDLSQFNETLTTLLPLIVVDGVTGALTQFSLVYQDEDGNNNQVDLSQLIQTLTPSPVTIYQEQYAGRSANGTTQAFARNATMTRTGAGQWQVRFTAPHPDGANYHPSLSAEEDANRDNPKIIVVQGSQNANGFDIMLTLDDNGNVADTYSDQPWSWSVDAPISVLQSVTIS